jgi:hypothetical protein
MHTDSGDFLGLQSYLYHLVRTLERLISKTSTMINTQLIGVFWITHVKHILADKC